MAIKTNFTLHVVVAVVPSVCSKVEMDSEEVASEDECSFGSLVGDSVELVADVSAVLVVVGAIDRYTIT